MMQPFDGDDNDVVNLIRIVSSRQCALFVFKVLSVKNVILHNIFRHELFNRSQEPYTTTHTGGGAFEKDYT